MSTDMKDDLPKTHTAITQDGKGVPRVVNEISLPMLEAGTVMVKVVVVACM